MGQLRGALGIFAAEDPEPGPLLDRLAGFAAGVPEAMGTTAALCLVDLASREVRYACAGHPPPLVVPEGAGRRGVVPLGGALAAAGPRGDGPPPARGAGAWQPGDTVLLYTDGLVERAARVDRRRRSSACGAPPAAAAAPSADALCDALLGDDGGGGSGDDTALLALRLDPATPEPLEVAVPADAVELATLRTAALRLAPRGRRGIGRATTWCWPAARRRPTASSTPTAGARPGEIRMRARLAGGAVELEVADTGRWRASPAPGDRGRGLGMMRALMDDVAVRTDAAGTVVRMTRRLGRGPRRRGRPAAAGEARGPRAGRGDARGERVRRGRSCSRA